VIYRRTPYYAKYRDGQGIVRTVPTGCRDERNAQAKLVELERQAELVKAGVLKPQEVKHGKERQRPLEDHLVGDTDHLLAKGVTEPHRVNTLRCLRRLLADCKWTTLADLRRESLEKWLALRTAERMSARTRNAHHTALISFVRWGVATERMDRNPFDGLSKANEKADPRRKRRALTEPELTRLLAVAQTRPLREAQTVRRGKNTGQQLANIRPEVQEQLLRLGRERALMYKMMVLTGLRQNELATLSVGQLELEQAVAVLDAADEKNREGNDVPLRADLVADLRAWLAEQLRLIQATARRAGLPVPVCLATDRLLFTVPKQLVRILNRDLALETSAGTG
jgi:integrase